MSCGKQVIVNADDYGLSSGANNAIASLLNRRRIKSATLMVNGPAFRQAADLHASRECRWFIGLHFNLTQFRAVSPDLIESSLTDRNGNFLGRGRLFRRWCQGRLDPNLIETELRAQLQSARASGFEVSHVDSHQHAHCIPAVFRAICRVAAEQGLPVRHVNPDPAVRPRSIRRRLQNAVLRVLARASLRACSDRLPGNQTLLSIFASNSRPSVEAYREMIESSASNCVELMVHPACEDKGHRAVTGIADVSEMDWQVLNSDAWSALLASGHYDFIAYPEVR